MKTEKFDGKPSRITVEIKMESFKCERSEGNGTV